MIHFYQIILFMAVSFKLMSQDAGISISTESTPISLCERTGSITFTVDNPSDPLFPLPYDIDIEYDEDGSDSSHEMFGESYTVDNLAPGLYHVEISLDGECSFETDVNLEYDQYKIKTEHSDLNHFCGDQPGSVTLSSWEGNVGKVIVGWTKDDEPIAGSSTTINPTGPGTYCSIVTDTEGCFGKKCTEIIDFNALIELSPTHLSSCEPNISDGSIATTIRRPYKVEIISKTWSGPNGFISNKESLSDLREGEYILTVMFEDTKNSISCQIEKKVQILPKQIDFELENIRHICGSLKGKVSIENWSGNNGGVTINWYKDGEFYTSSQRNILPTEGGTYCARIEDQDGCFGEECVVIRDESDAITVEVIEGECNGTFIAHNVNIILNDDPMNVSTVTWSHQDYFGNSVENILPGTYVLSIDVDRKTGDDLCNYSHVFVVPDIECDEDEPTGGGNGTGNDNCSGVVISTGATGESFVGGSVSFDNSSSAPNISFQIKRNGLFAGGGNISLNNNTFQIDMSKDDFFPNGVYEIVFSINGDECVTNLFAKIDPPSGCGAVQWCRDFDPTTGISGFIKFVKKGNKCEECEGLWYYADDAPPGTTQLCECISLEGITEEDCAEHFISISGEENYTIENENIYSYNRNIESIIGYITPDQGTELSPLFHKNHVDITDLKKAVTVNNDVKGIVSETNTAIYLEIIEHNTFGIFYQYQSGKYLDLVEDNNMFNLLREQNGYIFIDQINTEGDIVNSLLTDLSVQGNFEYQLLNANKVLVMNGLNRQTDIKIYDVLNRSFTIYPSVDNLIDIKFYDDYIITLRSNEGISEYFVSKYTIEGNIISENVVDVLPYKVPRAMITRNGTVKYIVLESVNTNVVSTNTSQEDCIEIMDFSEEENLSPIVLRNTIQHELISFYPNPTNNFLNIMYNSNVDEKLNIEISNLEGKILSSSSYNVLEGANTLKLKEVAEYIPGTYNISLKSNSKNITQIFIKI